MKGHRQVKPIVGFKSFYQWEDWGDTRTAILVGVEGHPRLGNERIVYTSKVVSVDNEESPTLIETLNTIYKRMT